MISLFGIKQRAPEEFEPVRYSVFKRTVSLPRVGIPELKDVWALANDAENPKSRYGREIATLKLLDLSRNADDIHVRKQAKEALRYVS